MQQIFLRKSLPLILLGGLLLIGLTTIFVQAGNYGVSVDEPMQDSYGHAVLAWYRSLGKDTSFLTIFPSEYHMPEHGGFFDAIVAEVENVFSHHNPWHIRHIVTALTGLLGIVAIALCGYELGGAWVAFLAALGLWLYPRYYGAIFNNPKDIPAAVTLTFVLWSVLLLIKQWTHKKLYLRNSILVGFCIGLAAAIRVNAVIWFPILLLILIAWWLLQGKRTYQEKTMRAVLSKQAIAAAAIGITSFLTMMIFWPYIFLNPFANLYQAIEVMSRYPWNGPVLFNGIVYTAPTLPRSYSLIWLLIGSPPTLILFTVVGLGVICAISIKKRVVDPMLAIVVLAFVIPLGTIIGLHSVLYDSLRQILFLIPPMILLAVYGLVQTVTYLAHRKHRAAEVIAAGLAALTMISYGFVVIDMLQLSPFEYTYFSPLIGGIAGANGKYQTDYENICFQQSSEWLTQNYHRYTNTPTPTVQGSPFQFMLSPYLPAASLKGVPQPDFFVGSTRDNHDLEFPTYTIIHTIDVENIPVCVIKVNPALLSH